MKNIELKGCRITEYCLWKTLTCYTNMKDPKKSCSIYNKIEKIILNNIDKKKGKWVKVSGYATPGGDPVWKCSECGKGIHVFGIENNTYNNDFTDSHQWVSCPNCGAEMVNNYENE